MLRYVVLILLIVLVILTLVNLIFSKILKTLTLFTPPKKKDEDEILYKDNDIVILKGKSKEETKNGNKRK